MCVPWSEGFSPLRGRWATEEGVAVWVRTVGPFHTRPGDVVCLRRGTPPREGPGRSTLNRRPDLDRLKSHLLLGDVESTGNRRVSVHPVEGLWYRTGWTGGGTTVGGPIRGGGSVHGTPYQSGVNLTDSDRPFAPLQRRRGMGRGGPGGSGGLSDRVRTHPLVRRVGSCSGSEGVESRESELRRTKDRTEPRGTRDRVRRPRTDLVIRRRVVGRTRGVVFLV